MRKYLLVIGSVIVLIVLCVVVYTAFPYSTTDCLRSHNETRYQFVSTCEKEGKGEECTSHVQAHQVIVCDIETSPTPHEGWMYKKW